MCQQSFRILDSADRKLERSLPKKNYAKIGHNDSEIPLSGISQKLSNWKHKQVGQRRENVFWKLTYTPFGGRMRKIGGHPHSGHKCVHKCVFIT